MDIWDHHLLRLPFCPGHLTFIHTFIVNLRDPRFGTQYTELQLQFSLLWLPHAWRTHFNSANIANRWMGLLRPPINCLKSPRINPCVSNLKSLRLPCFGDSLRVEPPRFLKNQASSYLKIQLKIRNWANWVFQEKVKFPVPSERESSPILTM